MDFLFLGALAKEADVVDQKVVNNLSSKCSRVEKPNDEEKLDGEIERKVRNKIVKEIFNYDQKTKDNPISQPLSIISGVCGLQSTNGRVGRIEKPNKICDRLSTAIKKERKKQNEDNSQNNVSQFQIFQVGVLRSLFLEKATESSHRL